jgi:GWxTD domain-containing protein
VKRAGTALLLAATLAAGLASAQLVESSPYDGKLEDWPKGPVRYIINRAEHAHFKSLQSDEERQLFIERFWERRDPDPRNDYNEYRMTFWTRVLEANRRFLDSALPGWRTDRGKIFILLGEPDDVQERSEFDIEDPDTAARGLLRWFYKNLPTSRSLDPETVVAFVRDNTGDYRLSHDPEYADVYFDPLQPYDRGSYGEIARLQDSLPSLARSELGTALDLGRLQQVPTQEQALRDTVLTREFFGTMSAELVSGRFPARGGDVHLTLTLILPRSEIEPSFDGGPRELEERFRVVGRLEATDGTEFFFDDADFRADPDPAPADPLLRLQARRSLPSGRYRLAVAAFDLEGDRTATVRRDESLPEWEPSVPMLSDMVLASRLRPVEAPERRGYAEPFVLGDLEVVARGGRPLRPSDHLRIYFQVHSPPEGEGEVRLTYRFARRAPGSPEFEPVGPPRVLEQAAGVQTWDLPLAAFPPGLYRVVVEASSEGGTAQRSLEFEVLETGGEAAEPEAGVLATPED